MHTETHTHMCALKRTLFFNKCDFRLFHCIQLQRRDCPRSPPAKSLVLFSFGKSLPSLPYSPPPAPCHPACTVRLKRGRKLWNHIWELTGPGRPSKQLLLMRSNQTSERSRNSLVATQARLKAEIVNRLYRRETAEVCRYLRLELPANLHSWPTSARPRWDDQEAKSLKTQA